jgi:cytochrome c oxidase cbb3-type subunit 3
MSRRAWPLILLAATVSAQDRRGEKLYLAHCAACHGDKGQGARGTVLAAPRLKLANTEESMMHVIRRGIAGTEMPPAPLAEDEIRLVAAYVRDLGRTAPNRPGEGAERGRQLYESRGGCAQCHTIGGRGGVIGPDLGDVGSRRNADYLRRALTDPEADVAENFSQYRWFTYIPDSFLVVRLETRDGRKLTAVRLNEDAFSVQVRDLEGRFHSFFKAELKELRKEWGKSLMPSFRDKFTEAEIGDLVAYLQSLRGAP